MLYLLIALLLLSIMIVLFRTYKRSHDRKKLFLSLALFSLLLLLSYTSKILFLYKPLFILHLALLLTAWWHYYRYIFKDTLIRYWIFSPLLSVALFILIALFFRENG